ncbi:MAG: hypothetical protein JW909_00885 [Planctomycetes bacterium]|nr:hypothetical protein [Planctomycetota bacterium]
MKCFRVLGIIALAAALGCGSGGPAASSLATPSAALSAVPSQASALPAAGDSSRASELDVSVLLGDVLPVEMTYFVYGALINPDESNIAVNTGFTYYARELSGTGWQEIDEFSEIPTAYTADIYYSNAPGPGGETTMYTVGLGYLGGMEKSSVRIETGFGGLDDFGFHADLLDTIVAYDYYVLDNFTVGGAWKYEHILDELDDSYSDSTFSVNFGCLFDVANPLLLKVGYGQVEINNSDSMVRQVVVSADWVVNGDFLVGLSACRNINENNWGSWIQNLDISVAFRIGDSISLGLNYFLRSYSFSGADSYGAYGLTYSQRF